ncbi:hypothetical protein Trydic_g5019 [Trypoxylus dichotomus]
MVLPFCGPQSTISKCSNIENQTTTISHFPQGNIRIEKPASEVLKDRNHVVFFFSNRIYILSRSDYGRPFNGRSAWPTPVQIGERLSTVSFYLSRAVEAEVFAVVTSTGIYEEYANAIECLDNLSRSSFRRLSTVIVKRLPLDLDF